MAQSAGAFARLRAHSAKVLDHSHRFRKVEVMRARAPALPATDALNLEKIILTDRVSGDIVRNSNNTGANGP